MPNYVSDEMQRQLLMADPRIAQLMQTSPVAVQELLASDQPIQTPAQPIPNVPSLPEMFNSGQAEVDRKGLFGMSGKTRDIIGLLGDALMVGFGRGDPVYAKRRQDEKLADTLLFEPGQAGKLALEGFGSLAMGAKQQGIENTLASEKAKSEAAQRNAKIAEDRQKVFYTELSKVAGILRGGNDPETRKRTATMARNLLASKGITLPEGWEITDDFSDEYRSALENMLIDPEAFARLQEQTSYHDAMIAESGAKRASLDEDRAADNNRADRELVADTLLRGGALRVAGAKAGNQIRRDNQPIHIRNATQTASGPKGTIYLYKGKWMDKAGREVK